MHEGNEIELPENSFRKLKYWDCCGVYQTLADCYCGIKPGLEIHLSTQASATSTSQRLWLEDATTRVVGARSIYGEGAEIRRTCWGLKPSSTEAMYFLLRTLYTFTTT